MVVIFTILQAIFFKFKITWNRNEVFRIGSDAEGDQFGRSGSGGGFSGIYILQNLRKRGFRVKLYEAGNYIGGTWHWNRYPGARVDSDIPTYQFSDPATWDFPWTERFPQHAELRQYFRYLDSVWDLSKDTEFNTCVSEAKFHNGRSQWEVKTEDGWTTWTRHLFLCTGSTSSKWLISYSNLYWF